MKILKLALLAALPACLWAQTVNNGSRIFAAGVEMGASSYLRPQVVNGAPPTAECNTAQSITSSTNASPIVVTKASHGLSNGNVITVYGHATNTAANGTWMVGGVTTNTFELCGYWDGTTCQNPSTGSGVGGATGYFSTQVGRVVMRNDAANAGESVYACTDSTGSPAWTLQTGTVASGTAAMGTGAISSGTCASAVTVAATGVATTDIIVYTPNTDPTAVTGYGPSSSGSLYIWAYPTAGDVNFKVCNNTGSSITPSALTLNWRVAR